MNGFPEVTEYFVDSIVLLEPHFRSNITPASPLMLIVLPVSERLPFAVDRIPPYRLILAEVVSGVLPHSPSRSIPS